MSLIEAMYFVDKQNCFLSIHTLGVFGLLYHLLHVLFSGNGCIDLGKFRTGGVGYHFCQSRFSGPRRAIEDQRAQFVCLDRSV